MTQFSSSKIEPHRGWGYQPRLL